MTFSWKNREIFDYEAAGFASCSQPRAPAPLQAGMFCRPRSLQSSAAPFQQHHGFCPTAARPRTSPGRTQGRDQPHRPPRAPCEPPPRLVPPCEPPNPRYTCGSPSCRCPSPPPPGAFPGGSLPTAPAGSPGPSAPGATTAGTPRGRGGGWGRGRPGYGEGGGDWEAAAGPGVGGAESRQPPCERCQVPVRPRRRPPQPRRGRSGGRRGPQPSGGRPPSRPQRPADAELPPPRRCRPRPRRSPAGVTPRPAAEGCRPPRLPGKKKANKTTFITRKRRNGTLALLRAVTGEVRAVAGRLCRRKSCLGPSWGVSFW